MWVIFLSEKAKLKYKDEDLKMLAGFTFLDDDFMTFVFDRNIEATELVLNIILDRNDLKVIEVVAQREYKNPVTGGRSIKLDIYAEDSDGKVYDVEVQEAGTLFEDGSHIIYVNGSYKDDTDPVGKLMHDFRCTSAVDMFYQELAKPVRHFKETEGGRSQVCKAMEERIDREKEKERIDNSFEHIKNLMESMKMTAEQAMIALKIPDTDRAVLAKKF